MLETLEQRRLLSIAINHGVLNIAGSSAADQYIIAIEDDQLTVSENGVSWRCDASLVSSISADLGDGNDLLDASAASLRAIVSGGAGVDTLIGTPGADTLYGDGGDDYIRGGPGDDYIPGGDGRDTLIGNQGRDTLIGQLGNDRIAGGKDDDNISGNQGSDDLRGDLGNDNIRGGKDSDTLRGNDGNDILHGDRGTDDLYGANGDDRLYNKDDIAMDYADGGAGADIGTANVIGFFRDVVNSVESVDTTTIPAPMTSRQLIEQITEYGIKAQSTRLGLRQHISQLAFGTPSWWLDTPQLAILRADGAGMAMTVDSWKAADATFDAGSTNYTNIQESGVDEADLVETDGTLVYWIDGDHLRIINPQAQGGPAVVAELDVPGFTTGMYLNGTSLTILSSGVSSPVENLRDGLLRVAVYDVSDPQSPSLTRETYLDGSVVTSRMTTDGVHLVLRASPRIPIVLYRISADGNYVEYESEQQYRDRLASRPESDILPGYCAREGNGAWTTGTLCSQWLVGANDGEVPSLLTVATIDNTGQLKTTSFSDRYSYNTVVYASQNSIYIAENDGWLSGDVEITRVDLTDAGPVIGARGSVAGQVIGQFAMDEQDDAFRIVTNSNGVNSLYVMQQEGEKLNVVGKLSGFGANEQIQSVRFTESMAYVVTFRRTDPLFVIDLTDQTNPVLRGELTIPGFSSYLQPISDTRLIGLGYDAELSGRTTGLQMSLFDISDPAAPKRIATSDLGISHDAWDSSEALNTHHAFSYFADHGLVAVPVTDYEDYIGAQYKTIFVRVSESSLEVAGSILHTSQAARTVEVKGIACAFDQTGVKFVDLTDPNTIIGSLDFGDDAGGDDVIPVFAND